MIPRISMIMENRLWPFGVLVSMAGRDYTLDECRKLIKISEK